MLRNDTSSVELLVLGAGWTYTFLGPLLKSSSISHAATTTSGRDETISFKFDPESSDTTPYKHLPTARTVLVTFPLTGTGQSKHITSLYRQVHGSDNQWIQLGSTGIFTAPHWNDHESSYNKENARAIAEDELMECADGCVMNLAGLYGGARDPKAWVTRVAKSKEDVKGKKALHLIHGEDVARGIVAVHRDFTPSTRWLLTDVHVYDWWDLFEDWGPQVRKKAAESIGTEAAEKLMFEKWVGELMTEEGVRALPRGPETLGRVCDSRQFWKTMGIWPSQGRVR